MFRKHTIIAATLLLATTINTSFAECGACRPIEKGCAPTCRSVCSINRHSKTTPQDISTTNKAYVSTCNIFCCSISGSVPTIFPQEDIQLVHASSTGEDYTTQSALMQEQKMANLLNQDRKNNGLGALTLDAELCRIARIKSADMRDNRYFAHESPTYGRVGEMLRHFGYRFSAAGENIAHHANVDKAQAAFMSSQGHRQNILGSWTKMGIGIVTDANGYIYATQIFAR